jgi:hypothetical protein
MHQGVGAPQTDIDVLSAWQHVAELLGKSEKMEDRDLGREAANFMGSMQTVARARYLFRQRRNELERENERREALLRGKALHPEHQGRSRER